MFDGCHAIRHTNRDYLFDVSWRHYVAYNVFNESYTSWDESSEFEGNPFRLYRKSRYLDFVRNEQNVEFLAPGHKHWGICCEWHIIDVVSQDEPIVARFGQP